MAAIWRVLAASCLGQEIMANSYATISGCTTVSPNSKSYLAATTLISTFTFLGSPFTATVSLAG